MVSGLPWWLSGKQLICQCKRCGFNPWVGKILWRRAWQPTPVLLPGEFHGQRSLASYSPWGCKESDTTERLILLLSLVAQRAKNPPANARDVGSIPGLGRPHGNGNCNSLQSSCLGNPMDREVWQAAVHRIVKELVTTERLNKNKGVLIC